MFKKICSLILILLMVLSVIGVCSAGTITLQYPTLDDISSNTDFYRYSGDKVHTLLFASTSRAGDPVGMGWLFKRYNIGNYTLFDGRIQYDGTFDCYFKGLRSKDTERLPGYKAVYTIPDSYIGDTIYGRVEDGNPASCELAWFRINNYKDSNIIIHFWDRGSFRDPHIDVRVNGVMRDEQNGGNGKNVEFTM